MTDEHIETRKNVARSTALMSAATLTSRITGFLRTWACAFALGNTVLTSAYQVANSVPNMLYELVAGGVLSTAFLPVFLALRDNKSEEEANLYASNLFNVCLIALAIIALLGTVFAPQIIATQTFMTNGEDAHLATWFFRFFAIQILFYGIGAIIGGILNAKKRFLMPALGPVANNVVVIIVMFGFVPISAVSPEAAMVWLAVGTSVGVLAQCLVQIPALIKSHFHYTPIITLHGQGLRETMKLALPAIIFTATNLVCVSVRNAFSIDVTPIGPSTLSYAWLWYQFPYGVLAVALSTAMFTEMSANAGKGAIEAFRRNVTEGLRSTFFLIIPMAAMLFACAPLLVTLYHAGQFTAADITMVSRVLVVWAICLPFYAGYMYLYFAFSARKDLASVVKVNVVASVTQIALYALFTVGVGSFEGFGLIGIPLADICFFVIMFFVLSFMLHRRIGSFDGREIAALFIRVTLASVVGGAVVVILRSRFGSTGSIGIAFIEIVIFAIVGLLITYGLCALMKIKEMSLLRELKNKVKGKLSR